MKGEGCRCDPSPYLIHHLAFADVVDVHEIGHKCCSNQVSMLKGSLKRGSYMSIRFELDVANVQNDEYRNHQAEKGMLHKKGNQSCRPQPFQRKDGRHVHHDKTLIAHHLNSQHTRGGGGAKGLH